MCARQQTAGVRPFSVKVAGVTFTLKLKVVPLEADPNGALAAIISLCSRAYRLNRNRRSRSDPHPDFPGALPEVNGQACQGQIKHRKRSNS